MDKVFLRENGAAVSAQYVHALQAMQDDGFLDFGAWEGQSPAAQQEWYNRCSQADLGGAMSWILFSDLDEYPVHINRYVLSPCDRCVLAVCCEGQYDASGAWALRLSCVG